MGRGAAPAVYETKTWGVVKAFGDHADAVTGVAFGKGANSIAAASADGMLKLYGA